VSGVVTFFTCWLNDSLHITQFSSKCQLGPCNKTEAIRTTESVREPVQWCW